MKRIFLMTVFALTVSLHAADEPKVQIALLLDTSNSMDGLIDQAKTRLWNIVNEMATARKDGKAPILEVALYEYGKSTIPVQQGHLKKLVPLTTDLDAISEALFALKTHGGDEYCGQVIQTAVGDLTWSKDSGDYKAIFIAGNEPFSQGTVPYREACRQAIASGIVVNTIHCGDRQAGIDGGWKEGANLADGEFMVIDQNKDLEVAQAPQDQKILALGEKLNKTYVAYGEKGKESAERAIKQDQNAASLAPSVSVERVVTKGSKAYRTSDWDLVAAQEEGLVDVTQIEEEDLPEPMRQMDDAKKQEFVDQLIEERKEIQQELVILKKERADYVAKQRKQKAGEKDSLDEAIGKAVKEQMKRKQFKTDN